MGFALLAPRRNRAFAISMMCSGPRVRAIAAGAVSISENNRRRSKVPVSAATRASRSRALPRSARTSRSRRAPVNTAMVSEPNATEASRAWSARLYPKS